MTRMVRIQIPADVAENYATMAFSIDDHMAVKAACEAAQAATTSTPQAAEARADRLAETLRGANDDWRTAVAERNQLAETLGKVRAEAVDMASAPVRDEDEIDQYDSSAVNEQATAETEKWCGERILAIVDANPASEGSGVEVIVVSAEQLARIDAAPDDAPFVVRGADIEVCTDAPDDAPPIADEPEPCPMTVGTRPDWMGVDQWDGGCACLLTKGHEPPCVCEHTASEGSDRG